jgi:hypothetical protein
MGNKVSGIVCHFVDGVKYTFIAFLEEVVEKIVWFVDEQ